MKEYRISKESLERAKAIVENGLHPMDNLYRILCAALDALCIPVEQEGWIDIGKGETAQVFAKGSYTLVCRHYYYWQLCYLGKPISYENSTLPIAEAQAWADAEIEKLEATCQCTAMGTHSPIGPHHPKCPMYIKPFGPGTRLVAPNGNEVMVIANLLDVCPYGVLGKDAVCYHWYRDLKDLNAALTAAGYKVKDDSQEAK